MDKLAVRDYVASRVGAEFLTRLYYGGDRPEDIDYEALPPQFVLKGTHGSGPDLRALVWDKSKLSRHRFIGLASRILRRRCGPEVNEWWYTQVPPRLLIEEMLLEADGTIPSDYKCYVFNGTVRYVQVIDGRHDAPRIAFTIETGKLISALCREGAGSFLDRRTTRKLEQIDCCR